MPRFVPRRLACLAIALLALAACARSRYDREWVAAELDARTPGARIGPTDRHDPALPSGVNLGDGLAADEAVSIALWNSPAFQADLARLSFARADLADAGALPNPMLTLLFPLGPHQAASGYLLMPLSALVQRPFRVAVARREVERVAHSLVQSGLDLIRDVRVAHAEAVAADARAEARTELVDLWGESVAIARARSDAGDIAGAELDALHGEALIAADQAARAEQDVATARLRLRLLVGLDAAQLPASVPLEPAEASAAEVDTASLVRDALAARPDLRAAELAVEAAGKRMGVERARIFQALLRFDGALDSNGFHPAAGIHQIELPIFNWNPGGRARAKAELEQALWRYAAVRQQIVGEVESAEILARQARESLERWEREVVATLEETVAAATDRYRAGDESYVVVLDATRRLQDARLRAIDLRVDLLRAEAHLDRSVGRRREASAERPPEPARGAVDAP